MAYAFTRVRSFMFLGRAVAVAGGMLAPCTAWAQSTPSWAKDAVSSSAWREIRAQLTPVRYTTLAAEIGARVIRVSVSEGGRFAAGQALVQFDCALQEAQAQKAKAELDATEQTYKANVRLADRHSIGQLELELSRLAVGKAKAEVGVNQAVLSKCTIVAPFPGRVTEQKVREQQYAQAGQPMLDILDDSALEFEFLVPSSWLAWLRIGAAFDVLIDETGKAYPAKFTRIGARVDPVNQSIKVGAGIDGQFNELMAGMSGLVKVVPPAAR